MSRYLCGFEAGGTQEPGWDVIIVGSGIAGLYTALSISSEKRILLLTKDSLSENNSSLAQGGIAAAMEEDDFQLHILDTLTAGCYHNAPEAVKIVVEEGRENILRLIELGVQFDRDKAGHLINTREGGHSRSRILHAKDATGREIIRALTEEVKKRPNITLLEYAQAIDLITTEEGCHGIVAWHGHQVKTFMSRSVVLATGGIGQLYQHTTNSMIASGDGIAMAYRAGVKISDMEFVQFHPTALYSPNYDRNFLISEAVRGEGGILRNEQGEAFMADKHPLKDLAPRDIVARAILQEMANAGKSYVYLDVTHLDQAYFHERFPNIYERCLLEGIDISKDFIPICPVEHYLMGGIESGFKGETSLQGLYACGEVARTGLHGANRLASNSLLEAIVFAKRIADAIDATKDSAYAERTFAVEAPSLPEVDGIENMIHEIQLIMTEKVFIFRALSELQEALSELNIFEDQLAGHQIDSVRSVQVRNMLIVGKLIVEAALARQVSLGSHVIAAKQEEAHV